MWQVFVAVLIGVAVLAPFVVGALVLPLVTGKEPDPARDGAAQRSARIAANTRAVARGDLTRVELDTAIRGYDKATVDALLETLSDPGTTITDADDIDPVPVVRGGYRMDETDALIADLLSPGTTPRL